MILYSYIVAHDTGFSPNPFFGYCTLACCKPAIRRSAKIGDWIVGLTPKAQGNKMIYAMRVDEKLEFKAYWNDRRFRSKRPKYKEEIRLRCGDNIYEPLPKGQYRQLRSMHSNGEAEDPKRKAHDLRGRHVLISKTYAYFGSNPVTLPLELKTLAVARGHRCRFSDELKAEFLQFIGKLKLGIHAPPPRWPKNDKSWRATRCSR